MTPENSEKIAAEKVDACKALLTQALTAIELAVLATPTGTRRAELTEAHLHMLVAHGKLK